MNLRTFISNAENIQEILNYYLESFPNRDTLRESVRKNLELMKLLVDFERSSRTNRDWDESSADRLRIRKDIANNWKKITEYRMEVERNEARGRVLDDIPFLDLNSTEMMLSSYEESRPRTRGSSALDVLRGLDRGFNRKTGIYRKNYPSKKFSRKRISLEEIDRLFTKKQLIDILIDNQDPRNKEYYNSSDIRKILQLNDKNQLSRVFKSHILDTKEIYLRLKGTRGWNPSFTASDISVPPVEYYISKYSTKKSRKRSPVKRRKSKKRSRRRKSK